MNKFLLIVVAILSMGAAQAQDLHVSGGYVHALEHLGSDIKEGASFKVGVDFDIFKKSDFRFGPSFAVTGFTNITTRVEEIKKRTFMSAGLTTGYDFGRIDFKSGLSANSHNSRPTEGYKFTERLVLNNAVEYRLKKDGNLGLRLGHDYFFNQYLFHYTHQTTLGLVFKF